MFHPVLLGVILIGVGLGHVISGGPGSGARVLTWQRGRGPVRTPYERTAQIAHRHRLIACAILIAGTVLVVVGAVS